MPDIKVVLDGKGINVSEKELYLIVKQEGFARLPRRAKKEKQDLEISTITPERRVKITFESGDVFRSHSSGLLCFWPYLKKYNLDTILQNSTYPQTKAISKGRGS